MNDYVLTCSSTADMSQDYFDERNIDYVPFTFNLDGADYPDDLGKSIPFDEFYQKISEGSMPTTSQINSDKYIEFFQKYLEDGKDVLHISFSSGLSGSYNSANIARNELLEKYPDRKLVVVDSLSASSGYGLLVSLAADLRDSGSTFEEIDKWLEDNKLHLNHWFFSSDLTHYQRGGRINTTTMHVGNLLKICPLMNVNNEGKLIPRTVIRTKKRVIKEIVNKMEALAQDGLDYSGRCFISHSNCYEDAREVAKLIEERFTSLEEPIVINNIGTVVGSHTGPGTVALFFMGDEREE